MRDHIPVKYSPSLWAAVCLLAALLAWPASAQENSGRGVIVYVAENLALTSGFEMLGCQNVACARGLSLLYPTLFDGVMLDTPALPADEQTYTINSDITWSDGMSLTAYDVAYSLLSRDPLVFDSTSPLTGLRIDDAEHITLAFNDVDCAAQARLDGIVIPAHDFNPNFRTFAEVFSGEDDDIASPREWRDSFTEWRYGARWLRFPQDNAALVTGGQFSLVIGDGRDLVYFKHGDLVIPNVNIKYQSRLQHFLQGDANLLLDLPFEYRADLRATPGIQLYEAPGYAVDYLVFNQSDPNYPRDAFVDGEPLEQLPHPFFSDVRVRRAIQLAIDVPALINGALYGNGVPLNGAFSPVSWAYDPTIEPPAYDPVQAERLLDEAGWRDIDGDGFRECFHCLNARPGASLSISLSIDNDDVRTRVGDMLRVQLARIGVGLHTGGSGGASQNFDLLLTGTGGTSPIDREPDLYRLFAREWDRMGVAGSNVGSVNHSQLETLLDTARRVPGCDIESRAAIYREAQTLMREDVPAIWLYARHDLYAARGIAGFAPKPGQPLWNITDWMVTR